MPLTAIDLLVVILGILLLISLSVGGYLFYRNRVLSTQLETARIELESMARRNEATHKLYQTTLDEVRRISRESQAKENKLNELFSQDEEVRDWGSTPIPQRLLDSL